MRGRIIGVETEYSLSHIPSQGQTPIPCAELSSRVISAAQHGFGSPTSNGSSFWPNGGKVYLDVGHVECASPECRGIREAVVYDKAADRLIALAADSVELELGLPQSPESIFAAKNNVDAHGTTFGSHENYLIARHTPVLPDPDEFFHYLARVLVPFLVSRTVICGSGLVQDGFQISQRAGHINSVTALDTREARPILNTRDEPHADAENYRRLHLILADANMAEWASFLKLGTASIVLTMAEDVYLDDLPELRSPVSALWAISKDPTLKTAVPLTNGRSATALEIQQYYLDSARAYFDNPNEEEDLVLERWSQTLSELAREPRLTIGKLDWVTKKDLIEKHLPESSGWGDARLKALDFRYHSLRTQSSIYGFLATAGLMERVVTDTDVERALRQPPACTRARARSAAMKYGGYASDWTECELPDGDTVYLDDPFEWAPIDALLRMGMSRQDVFSILSTACTEGTADTVQQALSGLAKLAERASSSLRSQICALIANLAVHPDRSVRLAAVNSMVAAGRASFLEHLHTATGDVDYRVRLAAESALRGEL